MSPRRSPATRTPSRRKEPLYEESDVLPAMAGPGQRRAGVVLASCGGGGGGSSAGGGVVPDGPRQPQATVVRNDDPTTARLSVGPTDYLGSVRVQFRSGDFGQNLDGDGINERFELEFRQTMFGLEAVAGPTGQRCRLRSGPNRVRWPSQPMARHCTSRWTAVVSCCAWPCPA